jgi:hypothetical protein
VPIIINLGAEQLQAAEREAVRRQSHNEAKGLKGRNRAAATGDRALELHRLGCIGEMAVAVHMGLEEYVFQATDAVRGSTDLPGNIEVKTRPKHGYDLLVQLDDDPSKVFVLVTHQDGVTQIAGWAHGHDVMKASNVRELVRGRPCHVFPGKALNPAETLVKIALDRPAKTFLGDDQLWTTEYQNGDVILHFSQNLVDSLGWQVGDTLTWDVDQVTLECTIRKADERNTKSTDSDAPGVGSTARPALGDSPKSDGSQHDGP